MSDFPTTINTYNPISYWRLGETSGTIAVDENGVQNGVYQQDVTLAQPGALIEDTNPAPQFDGVDDYIEIAHNDAYLLPNGSLQLWFKAESVGKFQTLFSKDSGGYDEGGHLGVFIVNGRLRVRVETTSEIFNYNSSPLMSANTWHQVTVTWGETGLKAYVDGNLVISELVWTDGLLGNPEPITLGANQWSSGNGVADQLKHFFQGQIDEVAIFGEELSGEQITALYEAGTTGSSLPPNNTVPVAGDDSYQTNEDTPLTVAVLSNDNDGDDDPLTLINTTNGSNGGTTINVDNTITYTPNGNFNGTDTFTYTVSDGNGGLSQATVTVTVNNLSDIPIVNDDNYTTPEDTPLTTLLGINDLLLNDSDADGDSLTVNTTPVNAPSNGSVILNNNGTFTYTPDAGFVGTDTFTYEVSDGTGESAQGTVSIQINTNDFFSTTINTYNPISYWRLGETSGTIAVDENGIQNGVYQQDVTLAQPGALIEDTNPAPQFDGVDDYIEIAHNDAYLLPNGSLQLWFKAESVGKFQTLFSKDSGGYDEGGHLGVFIVNGRLRVRVETTSEIFNYNSSPLMSANTWHQVTVTWGETGLKAYVDGNLAISELVWTDGLLGNPEPITLGANQWSSGNGVADQLKHFFQGQIDEVAIFGEELSEEQITALYEAGTTGGSLPPNNNIPIAGDDTFNLEAGTSFLVTTGDLLDNDQDVDGDNLTVTGITLPNNGTLTDNQDGTYTYTPNPDFIGTDTLTYTISDGVGGTATATVNLEVNAPPADSLDYSAENQAVFVHLEEGTVSSLNFGANFRLMPLGDSITRGVDASKLNAADPSYAELNEGYRLDLWSMFQDLQLPVDFVGSLSHGPDTLGDRDHEGHGGRNINWIRNRVSGYIADSNPDVIMLGIGTNDGSSDAADIANRLSSLLDTVLNDPNFTGHLLVGTVPPINPDSFFNTSRGPNLAEYNNLIEGVVTSKGSDRLTFVEVGSLLDPVEHIADLSVDNGLHPNQEGYAIMAQAWYDAVLDVVIASEDTFTNQDNVIGSSFDDVLVGNLNANTIEGGLGNDVLTGSSLGNTFVYRTVADGLDIITDFNAADYLHIVADGFGGGLQAGYDLSQTESGGNFVLGTSPTNSQATFLYDSSNGLLSYDVDGIGNQAAINLVSFNGSPSLSAEQIEII